MDFDEFQESEVMFSDYSSDQSTDSNDNSDRKRQHYNQSSDGSRKMLKRRISVPKKQTRIISSSSAPMNIPGNNSFRFDIGVVSSEMFDDDDDNEEEMMRLPPHLIVERRVSGEMARSYSPLKGRILHEFRDSVLRNTGFLER